MQRTMKLSTVKQMIVSINDKTFEVAVDSSNFDDVYIEAATRIVEKHKKNMTFFHKMKVVADCYEKRHAKTPKKHIQVNMYHILLNAGLYSIAELLREKTKNIHNVDLQLEPVRGSKDGSPS